MSILNRRPVAHMLLTVIGAQVHLIPASGDDLPALDTQEFAEVCPREEVHRQERWVPHIPWHSETRLR